MELTPSQLKLVVHYWEKNHVDVPMLIDWVEGWKVKISEIINGILWQLTDIELPDSKIDAFEKSKEYALAKWHKIDG
jgi:hypothetical protein